MHIGEVAARTELSLRSLRHWDEVGLLRPSGRSDGGFRQYTEADVEKILLIRRMKPLGFTLEQMAAALCDIEALDAVSAAGAAEARARLVDTLADATARRADLERRLAMADEFIALLGDRLA
ncbi:MerR family transcriptional regulator [Nostocoides sp. Soil756]|jgi:DNA-binding transcriptional MerR regulator|uniref:MerR family transcriptional regulator n=1 Tax=Nostocoides sp. Soil756 TaxID=1736399 RepID=UPI0006F53C28|nr:MerR family transcriptional regulator [Tetrasphaera sp. Soil756]KRE63778.1 MerR family transcriptional regulator [Tetrasphaera sp. Soil756]